MSSEFVADVPLHSDHRSPARFIWSHIRRHFIYAVSLMVGAFSNAALAAAVPYFIGVAFNAISQNEDRDAAMQVVVMMALAIIGSQLLRAVLQLMRNYSSEVFAQRIERDVRQELYASLLGKSMAFHDLQPVGEIMARVTNDVREMNLMMNPGVNLLLGSGWFLILPALAAPFIHPQLIIVPLAFIVLTVITQADYLRRVHPIAERVRSSFGQMNARLAEALDGLQVVKGSAQEDAEARRFGVLVDEVRDNAIAQGRMEAIYIPNLLFGLVFFFALLHAVLLYDQGQITIGDIVAYMGQIALFGFPVFTSLFSLTRIASGYASAKRILAIINAKMDLQVREDGHQAPIRGEVRFENVDFSYQEGSPKVLQGVSFSVKAGQTVAIVGQTGAGKTTISKLINRIYDPTAGRVLVDGVDVREWNVESLRSQVSVIEQDIFLFSRTIAQNIAFSDDEATQEQIEAAARKAQAHDFIMSFEQGYETIVGQRGVTLSGGQRQRLAIARAFESDPPILILDDSTSAIDSATEDEIQKAIWAAAKGRTTILITHRLSQIRWADHIIVLKQGRVVAQGSHDELLRSSEAYRRIFARYEAPATRPALPHEV
jgi:ATP-binding cassette subfamily B protein